MFYRASFFALAVALTALPFGIAHAAGNSKMLIAVQNLARPDKAIDVDVRAAGCVSGFNTQPATVRPNGSLNLIFMVNDDCGLPPFVRLEVKAECDNLHCRDDERWRPSEITFTKANGNWHVDVHTPSLNPILRITAGQLGRDQLVIDVH